MSRSEDSGETVRKRSGWLLPLAVLLVVTILSALFLLFYLFPSPPPLFAEQQNPTSSTSVVEYRFDRLKLWIPQNYLEFDSGRKGGRRAEVALWALLPDMAGWSNWDAAAFSDNSARSNVVYMSVRADRIGLSEADRLRRIYLVYATDPRGAPGPYGLAKYAFSPDSGYRNEDLFVGSHEGGLVVMHCARLGPGVPSPNCLRDMPLGRGASVTYRFKRSKLNHWREIAGGVARLMASFENPPK
ncbi:MAG TPA: hypothetical protein VG819_01440 [Rhizomicrobium sp.]|nr:hypothetical protein [Rhizomicrobium sp.]